MTIKDTAATLTNGPKPSDYQRFVERIENVQADIDVIDAQAREDKQPYKKDIKAVYDEAEEAGVSKKALRHIISKRRKLLKAKEAFERLDIADRSTAVSIEAALGPFIDTPLGQAAVGR